MSHQDEHLKVQERWYEKLHNWEKALQSYKDRLAENPHDIELVLGQMRCMEALGDWYVYTKLSSGGFLLTLLFHTPVKMSHCLLKLEITVIALSS